MLNIKMQKCGIIKIECSIASKIMTAEEVSAQSDFTEEFISEKLGFEEKRVAHLDERPSDFAIQAAKKALHSAGLNPFKIDFIIYASSGLYDYHFWSPSAYIQKAIGAKNAITFEINNGCNAANTGLMVAKSFFSLNSDWRYGLLIVSDTLSKFVDYTDKSSFPLYSFSDGAAAIIIGSHHEQNLLLGHGMYTDGNFANCSKIEYFGSNITHPTLNKVHSINNPYIKMDNEAQVNRLRNGVMANNYIKVILKAAKESNIKIDQISYILTTQNSQSITSEVMKKLKLSDTKHYKTVKNFGHIGAVDIFFGMNELIAKNSLTKGNHILCASTGIGFHWGAQVIQI